MRRKPRFINLGAGGTEGRRLADTVISLAVLISAVLVASSQTAVLTALTVAIGLLALGWSRHVLFFGREPSSWTVTADGLTARFYGLRRVHHRWSDVLGVKEEDGEYWLSTTQGYVALGRHLVNAALLARIVRERLGQTGGEAKPPVALAVARDVVERWLGVAEGGVARRLDWQVPLA